MKIRTAQELRDALAKSIYVSAIYHLATNSGYGEWLLGEEDFETSMDENGVVTVCVNGKDRKFKFSIAVSEIK